jgi:hypothetical protein
MSQQELRQSGMLGLDPADAGTGFCSIALNDTPGAALHASE